MTDDEVICPICKTKAQPLDKTGDADGFECAPHQLRCCYSGDA